MRHKHIKNTGIQRTAECWITIKNLKIDLDFSVLKIIVLIILKTFTLLFTQLFIFPVILEAYSLL